MFGNGDNYFFMKMLQIFYCIIVLVTLFFKLDKVRGVRKNQN
ncbi:hypothetical protein [uncultured Gammaproteobacteria bacterium]|nr:hypothetical protein [uncultured Gammaproteobacteria bacterium]